MHLKLLSVLDTRLCLILVEDEEIILLLEGKYSLILICNNFFLHYIWFFLPTVLNILCEMGDILSGMNIKSAATNWKCYVGLLQKYSTVLQQSDFVPPLKLLSSEISNNIDTILNSVSFLFCLPVNAFHLLTFVLETRC